MSDEPVRLPAPAFRDDIRPHPEDVAKEALARVAELEAERDRLREALRKLPLAISRRLLGEEEK
jgi:hypothetical protein